MKKIIMLVAVLTTLTMANNRFDTCVLPSPVEAFKSIPVKPLKGMTYDQYIKYGCKVLMQYRYNLLQPIGNDTYLSGNHQVVIKDGKIVEFKK